MAENSKLLTTVAPTAGTGSFERGEEYNPLSMSEAELISGGLDMRRQKRRRLWIPIGYRGIGLLVKVIGTRNVLRACLNASWFLHRIAFELSGRMFGDSFHCSTLGLSPELLMQWLPSNPTIVDLGCGHGRWCRILAPYAKRVVGIDTNEKSIAAARAKTTARNVEFHVADVTRNLPGVRFDAALLTHVLEHIDSQHLHTFLTSIRKLSDVLVVEVPDFESNPLNAVRRQVGCPFYSDADHVREYTAALARRHLSGAGWDVREVVRRGGGIVLLATQGQNKNLDGEHDCNT